MSKRLASDSLTDLSILKNGERSGSTANVGEATDGGVALNGGMGEFEDAFEDEIESDEDVVDAEGDSDDEEAEEDEDAADGTPP